MEESKWLLFGVLTAGIGLLMGLQRDIRADFLLHPHQLCLKSMERLQKRFNKNKYKPTSKSMQITKNKE
ncbi:hypothetical protein [Helicobacter sp. MIT 05-5294]|uniref:hypothetical protein n=1 Tax=Helicobacter sp. MIT 05-5294 TaxID=1548150 RepID=UPI0010FD48DD|nr:hypothetical protein [Helicobacter sp. MIT 05-5294]TLD87290.1 hypothetical protein LS69_004530 [Helicobacter sp. MIT 05-5294]